MSFKINGKTRLPKTAIEHADKIIENVNQYLTQSDAKDKTETSYNFGKVTAMRFTCLHWGTATGLQTKTNGCRKL